ncbi:MAG: MATE family efflux transporter, partial [Oscillospiraceae bacterium]|nr:MATE family efflux transporter [Oscillospiraceae bacterium]
ENTIDYAASYMRIYAMGTIFVQLTLGMNAFITAQGFTKVSMKSVMIGAVTNIILDPIFIYGLDMGVAGAALATILAQGCSCVWVLSFLFGEKSSIKLKSANMRLDFEILGPCIALGLAMFIMNSSESVIFLCYNTSLLKYGGDIAVGAMTILMSVTQLAMLPLQGVGQGAQPIISYNYGAGNADRVRAAFKLLIKVNMTYAVCMWLFVQGFPQIFTTLFTNDAALAEFAKTALRVYFAVLFMFGIQISCQMTFGALGRAKESILVAVMRKFVLMIPMIYLLPAILPVDKTIAVYMAEPVSDFFAMSFTAVLFYFRFKKAMEELN